jgi:hypothetical protein
MRLALRTDPKPYLWLLHLDHIHIFNILGGDRWLRGAPFYPPLCPMLQHGWWPKIMHMAISRSSRPISSNKICIFIICQVLTRILEWVTAAWPRGHLPRSPAISRERLNRSARDKYPNTSLGETDPDEWVPRPDHRTLSDKSGLSAHAAYPRTRKGLGSAPERVSMYLDTPGARNWTLWDTGGFPEICSSNFWISKFFKMSRGKLTSAGYMSRLPDTFGHFWTKAGFWPMPHIHALGTAWGVS